MYLFSHTKYIQKNEKGIKDKDYDKVGLGGFVVYKGEGERYGFKIPNVHQLHFN